MADKDFHQALDFVLRAHLIQRNADGVVLMPAKIDARFVCPKQDGFGLHLRQANSNRIEVRFCCDIESELPQSLGRSPPAPQTSVLVANAAGA